jgi:hypothetical protein
VAAAEDAVNFPWAICIARHDARSLAALRLAAGIEVGEAGGDLWVRGQQSNEQLNAKLSALPARARYEWLAANQLRHIHQRIPAHRLPELHWQSLDAWLRVEMPAAALPGALPAPVALRLVRSSDEREPELLLTPLEDLKHFATMAARVRLERLQFAANSDGDALVRGRPLPPLPGLRFVIHGGVAVPAGFSWEPNVSPEVLARRFAVSADALVLWNEDNSITRVHSEQFVPLSRSALRATQQALDESA